MPKRRLYGEPVTATLAGTSPFFVKSAQPVQKGWVRFVTSASVVDRAQSNRSFAFGKIIGKIFIQMEAEYHTAAEIGSFTRNTHHFIANEYPVWYCISSTAANVIDAYFEGYEVEIEDQE